MVGKYVILFIFIFEIFRDGENGILWMFVVYSDECVLLFFSDKDKKIIMCGIGFFLVINSF